jgi:hypothetical protein
MKQKQLIGAKRQCGVGPPFVVTELDLVYTGGKPLDNRADLATQEALVGGVFQQRNYGKCFEFAHGAPQSNSTKQLVKRGNV